MMMVTVYTIRMPRMAIRQPQYRLDRMVRFPRNRSRQICRSLRQGQGVSRDRRPVLLQEKLQIAAAVGRPMRAVYISVTR